MGIQEQAGRPRVTQSRLGAFAIRYRPRRHSRGQSANEPMADGQDAHLQPWRRRPDYPEGILLVPKGNMSHYFSKVVQRIEMDTPGPWSPLHLGSNPDGMVPQIPCDLKGPSDVNSASTALPSQAAASDRVLGSLIQFLG